MDKPPMITVSHDVLESLDQLFYSGARGTHLLFSTRAIRAAFDRVKELDPDDLDVVAEQLQPVLTDLLELEDNEDRRDFIEGLEAPVQDVLVHLYFGFLERYLTDDQAPEILH